MTNSPSITGQCLCGACAWRTAGPLEKGGICHCADCRRVTGSAFGVSFRVEKSRLTRTGETRTFSKAADSGTVLTRHFCPVCSSPLYTESQAHPDAVFIKVGSLDMPEALTIDREMWTRSKVLWSDLPATAQKFEQGRI